MIGVIVGQPWVLLFLLMMVPFFGIPLAIIAGVLLFGVSGLGHVMLFVILMTLGLGIIFFAIMETFLRIGESFAVTRPAFGLWRRWTERRVEKYIRRYGIWSLALLMALPLPYTGAHTGSLFSKMLNYTFRDYLIGLFIGTVVCTVICGGIIVIFVWGVRFFA